MISVSLRVPELYSRFEIRDLALPSSKNCIFIPQAPTVQLKRTSEHSKDLSADPQKQLWNKHRHVN